MTQLLRNIATLESMRHDKAAEGAKAKRLRCTGRASNLKLEAKIGYQPTKLDEFCAAMTAAAGVTE